MRKACIVLMVVFISAFSGGNVYKDGTYKGISRSFYTNEPYYGHTNITVENGKIVRVTFIIRDSVKHECFDDEYKRYFEGNDLYVQQCINDRRGVISYPDSLLKYQNLNKVDVISGATWSYNIFKASAEEALSIAVKK